MSGEIEPARSKIEMNIETNIPAGECGGLARLKQGPDWETNGSRARL